MARQNLGYPTGVHLIDLAAMKADFITGIWPNLLVVFSATQVMLGQPADALTTLAAAWRGLPTGGAMGTRSGSLPTWRSAT